jgi:hypothetical protein
MDDTVRPSKIGQLVTFVGYGGNVRQWHCEVGTAVVVGFTTQGNPVIEISGSMVLANLGSDTWRVTDTLGCARVIDSDGFLLRRKI